MMKLLGWLGAAMLLSVAVAFGFTQNQAPAHGRKIAASVLTTSGLPGPNVPSGLGVNIHFTKPQRGEMRMLAATGLKWVRMDLIWSHTERTQGHYNFSSYDRLLTALRHHHMRALFILDYGNPLYHHGKPPTTPASRRAFVRWAAAAVRHFAGKGIVWEMWNEPNGAWFWKPVDPVAYAQLAVAVGRKIRSVARRELYIGPAASGIDLRFLKKCFQAGTLKYWNAVSVHPYRRKIPETVIDGYARLRKLIAEYEPANKNIPIISSEWGYSTVWMKRNAARQARYLTREFLTNLMCHIPLSIWYDWRNDGNNRKPQERHFGMVKYKYHPHRHWAYTPKSAFFACRTLTHTLRGFHFEKRLKMENKNYFVLVFSRGRQRRWVVWSVVKPQLGRGWVTLPVPAGAYRVINYLGSEHVIAHVTAAGLRLKMSTGPQYVIPQQ